MGLRDAQLVMDMLTDALQADQGARGGVTVDGNDTLAILYYESSHMAELFNTFPENVFVDSTYNTNRLGMPLTCLMVEDGFVHGRNLFNAATAREDARRCEKMQHSCKQLSSHLRNRIVHGY